MKKINFKYIFFSIITDHFIVLSYFINDTIEILLLRKKKRYVIIILLIQEQTVVRKSYHYLNRLVIKTY